MYPAKFDPFLSLDCARVEGHLATLDQHQHQLIFCWQTLELDLSSSPVASLVSVTNAEGSLVRMRPPSTVYIYSPDGTWSESDGIR